jgi:hypothetical protein
MSLPHTSVDKLHEAAVEACLAYERACKRRAVKLKKLTITYEPDGEGFNVSVDEHPYPHNKQGNPIIPEEEKLVPGEDEPLPQIKD